uniref:Major facilitator superfamily (MFS) profile domain-containing protein n=1 Tax=Panagrolaimus superbus TaxID=310955 RepID=A0A914YQV1_9BILA
MAIVCMVHRKSGTNMTFSAELQLAELSMRAYDDTLNWSTNQITLILSATFYGGLFTMFWSGYLADRFAAKIIIFCAILDCVIVSGFTPFLAYKNFYALFFARVVMGLGEDFLGPAQASFITRWYSPSEMTRIGALTCAGKALAGTLSLPLSSIFCKIHTKSSLHLTFYVLTLFGSGWVIIWGLYSSDRPDLHRHITKEEKSYIETELQELGINQEPKSKKVNSYFIFKNKTKIKIF